MNTTNTMDSTQTATPNVDATLNGNGNACVDLTPRIKSAIRLLESGAILEVTSDDPSAREGERES